MQYPIAGLTLAEIRGRLISHYPRSICVFLHAGLECLVARGELERLSLPLDGRETTTWRKPLGHSWRDTKVAREKRNRHRRAILNVA